MSDTDTDPVGAAGREVGRRTIPAGEARTVVLRRHYDAPVEDVWDACTNPDRLARFFIRPKGELRPGGRFELEGNASGEVLACEPPRLLRLSWAYGERPVDQVELRLAAAPGGSDQGTDLELEHASVSRLVELDGRWVDPILNDPATGIWGLGTGWDMGLLGLDMHLRGQAVGADSAEGPPAEILALGEGFGRAWAEALAAAGAGQD
jgi:uncharacterized protein YndB with AHSA1/START domain